MTEAARSPLAPARPRRRAVAPGLISALLHAAILAALILRWPGFKGVVAAPDKLATVQLVMVERKGADQTSAAPTPSTAQPTPQTAPAAPAQTLPQPAPAPAAPVPPPEQTAPAQPASRSEAKAAPEKPVRHPAKNPAKPVPDKPAPQAAPQHAPVQMNLGGNNPDTNAIVTGGQVVPATPDAAYTNRQPAYPIAAARHGEQGAVLLTIHVLPDGRAGDVEVSRSSGYPALDQAALNAVRKWHFLPALKDGQPVESSFPFRVVFQLN
ncbi:MAG: energy transducer TonB [Rhodospirillales bacterium]|nr:energy transducer TonB [Rhodospirillales bacterium]